MVRPVAGSSAVMRPKPVEANSLPSPYARPPPLPSLGESCTGTRLVFHSNAPLGETALTRALASITKMRPPATTGSAVMRRRAASPAPIEADQIRLGAAERLGCWTRVEGEPMRWVHSELTCAAGRRSASATLGPDAPTTSLLAA